MFTYLRQCLQRSLHMFTTIARIMVPIMIGVKLANEFGLITWLGEGLRPIMGMLNLPAEAAVVLTTTALSTIYGGIASMAALGDSLVLTQAQLSAMGAMMLIAHNLPMEQAIVRKAGASFWFTACLRLSTACLYGALITWSCHYLEIGQNTVSLAWLYGQSQGDSTGLYAWWLWLRGSISSLFFTWLIILGLVIVLDIFERLGLTQLCTRALTPLLRFSGLEPQVAPTTTVGVLLGLSYGGALIIEATKRENFSPRTRLLALSWLSLCHSLIEDTLLVLALGANIWVILPGRMILTLLVLAGLAHITRPGSAIYQRYLAPATSEPTNPDSAA